ncbi:c-type cytochrome [Sneathiella chinensis]|uniref:Cytochrome c domain-containing protein n=2 Tax=Sneathiella chinensis TaxID=349750 RepID=A0ABQ5U4J8_9PROT|nr:cytochrome c [Sneathiella chinensis]GLQ07069.1 hypothetical protein GCM10007924_22900 [Sneathiella chinensis]
MQGRLPAWLAVFTIFPAVLVAGQVRADITEEGRYLTAAAGCQSCHTDPATKDAPFAGGRAMKTPFGVFYTPNITPDSEQGIGGWSRDDFIRAVKTGVSPEGQHYFPAFPYTSYTRMTDEDAGKIFAYLQSLPANDRPNRDHEIAAPFSWRFLQAGWKLLFFDEGGDDQALPTDPVLARGAYLTNALGHCGECHTPRNGLGGIDDSLFMAGAIGGGEGELVPNITPDPATGIGDWTKGDLASFLETGMKPNFDDVQGTMGDVITYSTSHLSLEDREAMAAYLLSLPAIINKIEKPK